MSVLIRLARLNYFGPGDIRDALGVVVRRRTDLFGLLTNDDRRLAALAATQEFDSAFIEALHPSWWWPFANPIPSEALGWSLRICPQCMAYAYHSLLFQMPAIDRCPWHGCKLVDSCTRCGKRLLDGYDQGKELMQCSCGHDHVNDTAALFGDSGSKRWRSAAIDRYRKWCLARQNECWLVAPGVFDIQGWKAVASLVDYPHSKPPASEDVILDRVTTPSQSAFELSATSGFEKFIPTMVALPLTWLNDTRAICRQLAMMMPPGTLTVGERRALDPVAFHEADRGCDAVRPWLLNLPGHAVGKVAILHTSPIDGMAIRMIASLVGGLDGSPHYVTEPASRRAFRKWIRAHPRGSALLESTIRRVFCRGYADGSRALLGQTHPDLFNKRATRPARRFPWVEIRLVGEPISRIAWTRQINV